MTNSPLFKRNFFAIKLNHLTWAIGFFCAYTFGLLTSSFSVFHGVFVTVVIGFLAISALKKSGHTKGNGLNSSLFTFSDALLSGACEHNPHGIIVTDRDERLIYANSAFLKMTGYGLHELLNQFPRETFHPRQSDKDIVNPFYLAIQKRESKSGELQIRKKNGDLLWIQCDLNPVFDAKGEFIYYVSVNTDISEKKASEKVIRDEDARFRAGMESLQSGLVIQDMEGTITFCNSKTAEILRLSSGIEGETPENPQINLIYPNGEPLQLHDHPCMKCIATRETFENLILGVSHPDEPTTWISVNVFPIDDLDGNMTGVVTSFVDVTQQLKQSNEIQEHLSALAKNQIELEFQATQLRDLNVQLASLAQTDGLTGLLNRRSFDERMVELVSCSLDHANDPGLILLDVDHFKEFNDSFGHLAGDEVLKQVAEHICGNFEFVDSAYRYGGEEFAVILTNGNSDSYLSIAEQIRLAIQDSDWDHRPVTASMGLAHLGSDKSIDDWINSADQLLYLAKQKGRNQVQASSSLDKKRISA